MTGGAGRADASGDRSVAAGGAIGRVNTGDFVTQVENATLLPPEALTVSPAGLVHLPERTQLFVGRARELALLDEGMGIQVLCGLGGIGKSTLAARWAADRVADHSVVWWITAETPAELDAGLADLARAMQPGVVGVLPEDALRERALQWLATNDDWLLVLDNVSAPADLHPLLARVGSGRIVVTSRRASGWQDIARTVVLDVLGPEEAAELFRGRRVGSGDGLELLCAELGYLPLALKQAAAYCAEAGITPRTYLGLLAKHPAEMFAATEEGGEAARTLARVWQVTLERLSDTPLAVGVLRIIAWWAPEEIPRRFLEPLGTALGVTEAVRRLAAHSMITLRDGELNVHRLVQAVVRADPSEETESAREKATGLLNECAPKDESHADRQIAVHAEALAGHTDPTDDTEDAAILFLIASGIFGMVMSMSRAASLSGRGADALRRIHGPDHPAVLWAVQTCALHRHMAGGGSEAAAELLTTGLADGLRVLGPDDPQTLSARRNLAVVLRSIEPERAVELFHENVEHCHRVLGARHPQTIAARYDLIEASSDADVRALEELLSDAERASPEDPFLCETIQRHLILLVAGTGETKRALAIAAEGVESCRRRYGDADSRTLVSRLIEVEVLREDGQMQRARALAIALEEDSLRVLGEGQLTELARVMQS
ncbi:Putative ATP/GTP-binding protein [Streptomyces venezuelae]|uniref:tetratricopeptide repeat protein n=1 Tax=Streptomyces gardneri TaxID=66892 RepID=UPI0006BD39CA|nr:tetratricopeptide repeat protein [Streptomyces gardneri]ALO09400.1 Putative ATP/GTP-binding protein [Streptomyces venezuelae]QPK46507.1 tetratricopeptide repeat protein [Streptomyces gardneri]WRK37897.1 tetratricopeptide repeat protein [Streptomyces venezuelae]CUM40187.1 Putative ATP/GTP-binding protein [Streptomyces venezuelae]